MKANDRKILLSGGGTGGSVTPLLALAEELGGDYDYFWLGGNKGPEREMVAAAGLKFKAIVGGKWRRYFSLKNFWDLVLIKIGFWQAFFIMLKWRPDLVLTAGSFISVPIVWAAWVLRVPVMVHQQDILPGLANKLMAPFAKIITVSFESSIKDFGKKAVWTGNPVRKNLQPVNYNFHLNSGLPIVLILGGGTGAKSINDLVKKSLNDLTQFCQVIHVLGKNKINNLKLDGYAPFEFLDAEKMASAMRVADLVITRVGMSTLSELSYLGKPAIIIPMPETHQEANAAFFRNRRAAITVKQQYLTPENFIHLAKDLLADETGRAKLAASIKLAMKPGANEAMAKIIRKLIG